MPECIVGVDLGGTNIKAALVDRDGRLIRSATTETETDGGPDHVMNRIVGLIRELDAEIQRNCIGIGVGVPGVVNWERNTVSAPPNFPDWTSLNVSEAIQNKLRCNVPVIVENDANVAALGSAYFGAGKPYDHFVMVTLGTGVGGAIIVDNKIFRGSTGGAGELGHMTIDFNGPLARSGIAGAAEAYLGQKHLSRYARYKLLAYPDSLVHETAGKDLDDMTPKLLFDAATAGDKRAIEIFRWAGHKLGCVLGSAVNLLDIRVFVIGGGTSAAGDYILDSARETIVDFVLPGMRRGLQIVREERGNEVAVLGAAQLILNDL